jgi:Protein of unknown function (DUF3995)
MRRDAVAYWACAWALVFAAMSFYWAVGGSAALDTIGGEIERQARDREPDFVASLWVTGVLKLLGAVVALALARRWGTGVWRRLVVIVAGVGGVLVALYGAAELVQHLLMATGAIDRSGLDDTAVFGHLLFWDPWWILGGVLFAIAAMDRARRSPRSAPGSTRSPESRSALHRAAARRASSKPTRVPR